MGNYLGRYGVYDGRHKDKYIRFVEKKRSERRSTIVYLPTYLALVWVVTMLRITSCDGVVSLPFGSSNSKVVYWLCTNEARNLRNSTKVSIIKFISYLRSYDTYYNYIISIGCVRCVSVCEAGRSVVNSGENSRSDPGFFSSLQFATLFKWGIWVFRWTTWTGWTRLFAFPR